MKIILNTAVVFSLFSFSGYINAAEDISVASVESASQKHPQHFAEYKKIKKKDIPSVAPQKILRVVGTVGIFVSSFYFIATFCGKFFEGLSNIMGNAIAIEAESNPDLHDLANGLDDINNKAKSFSTNTFIKAIVSTTLTVIIFKTASYFSAKREKMLEKYKNRKYLAKKLGYRVA